jgi:hypothetical protein
VDLEPTNDKASAKRGQEITVKLKGRGHRRIPAAPGGQQDAADVALTITLTESDEPPFPVEGDSTRPCPGITHGFAKPLYFHVLTRLKGSSKFYELDSTPGPVEPGN